MLSFASSPGNFFNRLGSLWKIVQQMSAYQTSQFTNIMDPTLGVAPQYQAEEDILGVMTTNYLTVLQTPESVASLMAQVAQLTINRTVFRDNPLPNQTLTSLNVLGSILEVIRQMKIQNATVLRQVVGASSQAVVGSGDGTLNISVIRPFDGLPQENLIAETMTATCTSDSYSGGRTAGNESWSVKGAGAQTDLFAFNWPLGSGGSAGLSAINPGQNNAGGNLLTNSDFTTFTVANAPDNFSLVVGTPGTNVFSESSITLGTGKALRILGDGSTLVQFTQQFNSSTGTRGTLSPQKQYGFNVYLRRGGSAITGVLVADLIDQNGVTVQDAGGAFNTASLNLSTLGTGYAPFSCAFRTPAIMPTTVSLRLRLTTPVSNTGLLYLDKMGTGLMTGLYAYGPVASFHSGGTPNLAGDYCFATATNSRGAGGTLNTWQTAFSRLFPALVLGNNILLPSSATPTVADTLLS